MTKVTFKYPAGIEVRCLQTSLKGTIAGRGEMVNGCIRYSVQPHMTDKDTGCPEQWDIDEQNIVPIEGKYDPSSYTFKYETGDKVKSKVNGFTGIIVMRTIALNGCEQYLVEGPFSKDNKRVRVEFFLQEVEYVNSGINKALEKAKSYVGCAPSRRERL